MFNFFKLVMCVAILIFVSGCVADRNDKRLVNPMEKMASTFDNGAIFKAGFNEHPLYEERRARNVGDGLVMNIAEVKKPAKDKTAGSGKSGDAEDADSEDRRARRDRTDEDLTNIDSNALAGLITMTVMEVMDNGNLFVSGGKQVSGPEGDKYVRITGVIDPSNITGGNMVQSTQVSEVRVELDEVRVYADRTASRISEGQSVFGGLFQSMLHN